MNKNAEADLSNPATTFQAWVNVSHSKDED